MPRNVPFRVVLTQGETTYKFFSLFEGKDGSIYIHPNRKDRPWITPKLEKLNNGMKINIENSITRDFDVQKITFHRSGYIHVSNKERERLRDGIRGPSFEKIEPPYPLCVIAPSVLTEMPIFKTDKKSAVVNLQIPEKVTPFYITISFHSEDEKPDKDLINRISAKLVLPMKSGYKLSFVLRTVGLGPKGEIPPWPKAPFFLMKMGKERE